MVRCRWCNVKNPLYIDYHDSEWGRLSTDESYLYEMLLLECFQAGLSWECILNKREGFRAAFDGFDPQRIACYDDNKVEALLQDAAIVRCERKIRAAIQNARVYLAIVEEFGGFFPYLLTFFPSHPIFETERVTSAVSDALSRDLRRRGMRYVGSVTVYSYLQAVGLIVSHDTTCYFYQGNERKLIWNSPIS